MNDQKALFKISGQKKDLGGGFTIARLLPQRNLRSIGPFVFLDLIGPVQISETVAMDVRPHPHIGLATVTYLFSGAGLHRDSLGNERRIESSDLALMTSGKGIVHSERTPTEDRVPKGPIFHGIQLWMALPKELEDCEPRFEHCPAHRIEERNPSPGVQVRVLLGELFGIRGALETETGALFADLTLSTEASIVVEAPQSEVGILVISGSIQIQIDQSSAIQNDRANPPSFDPAWQTIQKQELMVIQRNLEASSIRVSCPEASRIVILGGRPLSEPRHMWWNFVSSDKEKIRTAAEAWKNDLFPKVPNEEERIPLPTDAV